MQMPIPHELAKTFVSGFLAYSVHYASEKFYDTVCTPDGFAGFLQGLITTASPWCSLALSTMSQTQNLYSNFVLFGVSRLLVEVVSPAGNGAPTRSAGEPVPAQIPRNTERTCENPWVPRVDSTGRS
jgi:hypothetical protein